jgi:hypothetical protein
MKCLFSYLLFSFALSVNPLFSQDGTRDVIGKVFYKKKVFKIIFFDYKGVGEWPHRLPDGVFAFIIPDSTFQKQYPNILYDLAMSWAKEKMVSTRTFIAKPEGTVFITNGSIRNGTFKLLVRFDEMRIDDTKAIFVFHTTAVTYNAEMVGRYVKIAARLRKEKNGWKIKRLKISKIPCCDNFSST